MEQTRLICLSVFYIALYQLVSPFNRRPTAPSYQEHYVLPKHRSARLWHSLLTSGGCNGPLSSSSALPYYKEIWKMEVRHRSALFSFRELYFGSSRSRIRKDFSSIKIKATRGPYGIPIIGVGGVLRYELSIGNCFVYQLFPWPARFVFIACENTNPKIPLPL